MKNIFLTIAVVLCTAFFVKADFFPAGSTATYVDNGTGLDITVNIAWGSNTTEYGDGFVVTIDGVDYCIEGGATGAWGSSGSGCAFEGTLPSDFGDFAGSPVTVTITVPYPAGWSPGDPVAILIDGYGDAFGDDPTGVNSFYLDESIDATEFVPPPPPVTCASGADPDEFFNSGEDPAGNGVVSSTLDDAGGSLGAICADDFVVGTGGTTLDGILAYGFWSLGAGTFTDVTVTIYTDAGGVIGPAVCTYTEVPTYVGGAFGGDVGVQFSSPCTLGMGTYWLSVEVNGSGRWNWLQSAGQQGAEAQLIDPNDVFGLCCDWNGFTAIGLSGDMGFGLFSCGDEEPVLVPTLSQWGLMTLALLLMTFGALKIGYTSLQPSRQRK